MEDPELERPSPTGQSEWVADGHPSPEALVDDEVGAVVSADRGDLFLFQIGEEPLVELARLFAPPPRAERCADHVVVDVVGERPQHAPDVVARLEPEVLVDHAIHLGCRQRP